MRENLLLLSICISILLSPSIYARFVSRESKENQDACTCVQAENPSPFLQPDTKIRDITTKTSWGSLVSRLPNDDGWRLDNKRKALDESYGVKWEVEPKSVAEQDDKLLDAGGNEIFGDGDKLWFKAAPARSDKVAYEIYSKADPKKAISTDGRLDGNLYLYYYDKNGDLLDAKVNKTILKYLTTKKPN